MASGSQGRRPLSRDLVPEHADSVDLDLDRMPRLERVVVRRDEPRAGQQHRARGDGIVAYDPGGKLAGRTLHPRRRDLSREELGAVPTCDAQADLEGLAPV